MACTVRSIMAACALRSGDLPALLGFIPRFPAALRLQLSALTLPASASHPLSTGVYRSYSFVCRPYALDHGAGVRTIEFGDENEESEEEYEEEDEIEHQPVRRSARTEFQLLGNKEKKELRAYAHGLGNRLNVQQVGKLGVSLTVLKSISDALEAHEILKVKVLENCSSTMDEIVLDLERGTGGQVVGKIGRTVLLYRASLRKLAASEKRVEKPKRRSKLAMSAGRKSLDSQRSRR